MTWLKNILKF
jgi:hypothetical protein